MTYGQRNGSTRQWRRTRALVLKRDNNRCRLGPLRRDQGKPDVCATLAREVHHIFGWNPNERDLSRLMAACLPCNRAEGDPTRNPPDPVAAACDWWAARDSTHVGEDEHVDRDAQ